MTWGRKIVKCSKYFYSHHSQLRQSKLVAVIAMDVLNVTTYSYVG